MIPDSYRWLIVSALLVTVSCQRSQSGAPPSLERQASSGSAAAQYLLGRIYDYGAGVPEDDAKAALWYRRAAEQGYVRAQVRLGDLYFSGQGGVPQDYTQAAVWYRNAAE